MLLVEVIICFFQVNEGNKQCFLIDIYKPLSQLCLNCHYPHVLSLENSRMQSCSGGEKSAKSNVKGINQDTTNTKTADAHQTTQQQLTMNNEQ